VSVTWPTTLSRLKERVLRPGGRAVILLYHRIAEEQPDPFGLCVTPRHFEEHLQLVRRMGRPIHLSTLAHALRERKLPKDAVCVTFDDGYADNLLAAKPLLERYDIPATVFMTAGRGGRDREFWWDELERVFLHAERLPEGLELMIGGRRHAWSFGADALYGRVDVRRRQRWHMDDESVPTARHQVFREVYGLVQPLPEKERSRVLDELLAQSGLDETGVRPTHRVLEPDEVVELSRGGIVEIGAHTVSHPALPSQPPALQREEIARSKATIEEWLGAEVSGFAYPYGLHDEVSVAAVKDAGFLYACAGIYRSVWRGSDRYRLPRVEVADSNGDALGERLWWELRGERSPAAASQSAGTTP
jgi:peptidoglycan/xylan/chitin deacetylase (PgdA/CDA1 family)